MTPQSCLALRRQGLSPCCSPHPVQSLLRWPRSHQLRCRRCQQRRNASTALPAHRQHPCRRRRSRKELRRPPHPTPCLKLPACEPVWQLTQWRSALWVALVSFCAGAFCRTRPWLPCATARSLWSAARHTSGHRMGQGAVRLDAHGPELHLDNESRRAHTRMGTRTRMQPRSCTHAHASASSP